MWPGRLMKSRQNPERPQSACLYDPAIADREIPSRNRHRPVAVQKRSWCSVLRIFNARSLAMSTYVHHVPGRLRIRTAAVKRNPEAAARARQSLSAVAGVLSAEANSVTGSVTLRYDPATISQHDIVAVLRRAGYAHGNPGQDGPASPESVINRYADVVAEKIAAFVVKKVLERSAAVLIGALI